MAGQVIDMRAPVPRATQLVACAAAATAMAWVAASGLPLHVLVGTSALPETVPLGYTLSAFPAFGGFVGALALDAARRERPGTLWPRALLVAVVGGLSVVRLAGALPLSGHALLLFALLGYELSPPQDRDSAVVSSLVAPALLVVCWCKLVVWGDGAWFALSAAVGAGIGVVLARAARA